MADDLRDTRLPLPHTRGTVIRRARLRLREIAARDELRARQSAEATADRAVDILAAPDVAWRRLSATENFMTTTHCIPLPDGVEFHDDMDWALFEWLLDDEWAETEGVYGDYLEVDRESKSFNVMVNVSAEACASAKKAIAEEEGGGQV